MFKRLRWLSIGAVLGVWAYLWARERARAAAKGFGPKLAAKAVQGAEGSRSAAYEKGRELGARLRDALREGREAMAAKEAELREQIGDGNGHRG